MRSGATFSDYADDAAAATEYLRTRSEVKTKHIGIWGLSQGAWIGPLAVTRSDRFAFIVMVSGGR
jgi:hypothetical protein